MTGDGERRASATGGRRWVPVSTAPMMPTVSRLRERGAQWIHISSATHGPELSLPGFCSPGTCAVYCCGPECKLIFSRPPGLSCAAECAASGRWVRPSAKGNDVSEEGLYAQVMEPMMACELGQDRPPQLRREGSEDLGRWRWRSDLRPCLAVGHDEPRVSTACP